MNQRNSKISFSITIENSQSVRISHTTFFLKLLVKPRRFLLSDFIKLCYVSDSQCWITARSVAMEQKP